VSNEPTYEDLTDADDRMLYIFTAGRYIPTGMYVGGSLAKYPVHLLAVGDSFFVPGKTGFIGTVNLRARRLGIRVAQRHVIENGVAGRRIWRVA